MLELMVTVSAVRNNYSGIAPGTVTGSNLTDILLVLGCADVIEFLLIIDLSRNYIALIMPGISIPFLFSILIAVKLKNLKV